MKKLMIVTLFTGFLGFLGTTSVQAITIGISPVSQSVELGVGAHVDIIVSDLGNEIVSAYDLDIHYDSTILFATSVDFFGDLGGPFDSLQGANLSNPGLVDLAEVSFLSNSDLAALQGDSVTLASIWFDSIGTGTSDLSFSFDAFNDVKGQDPFTPLVFSEINNGSITVTDTNMAPVPEPSTYVLLGTGLVLLMFVRRRQMAGQNT